MDEDNQIQLNRFKNIPPNPSYIAGFIDGDGCIFIRKITDGFQSGFTISQCRTNVLQIIRYHFGGSITSSVNRNDNIINLMDEDNNEYYHKHNVRNQYNLLIRNNEYQILLDYLNQSFIIKEKQYQCLYKFNKIANLTIYIEEKNNLHVTCAELNKKCELNKIYLTRINIEYIAGLFDAEGCLFINKNNLNKFYISIAQKNHPSILHEIVKVLGFGKVLNSNIEFIIYNKSCCLKFIQLVKPHLIVKYNQAVAFETFLQTNDTNIKEQMYVICNKEKHEIEVFADLNQNDNGKEGYLKTVRLKKIKELICNEINIKQIYKEKSEKMMGTGNHNFGKSFSVETKKKMSISIRESKGGVTDEIIKQVRKLMENGKKNTEIQILLDLPRHTITRIKNGEIVCKDEDKKEKQSLTQVEVNLLKRKILVNEIIIVIEKFIKKWKPSEILDYLIEQRFSNNITNNLTIDIIKNIKRNLTTGKPIIYESELSKDKYEYYIKIINDFAKINI